MSVRAIYPVLLVLMAVAPARAEPIATIDAAWELYRAGQFAESESMCVSIGSPNALALAARAANVRALYLAPPKNRATVLASARRYGEAALALDPWHTDAALQLVIALGQSARLMHPVDAHVEGVADAAKTVLDRLAHRARGNPFYHAVLGAWHAEIVLRAGPTAAFVFYGARWELAVRHYDMALALAPHSLVIGTEYAKILLEEGSHRAKALGLLRTIVRSVPSDAADALVIKEARTLLAITLAELTHR